MQQNELKIDLEVLYVQTECTREINEGITKIWQKNAEKETKAAFFISSTNTEEHFK